MYIYIGSGPAFYNVIDFNIIQPLNDEMWAIIFFVQNLLPWVNMPGLFWIQFVANDLQFYALIMMPSIFMYLKRRRWLVLSYLMSIVTISIAYVFWVTVTNDFSSMLTIIDYKMFNELYRRPFGPMGYYALGIMLSIFYFEYSQAISNRELRKRNAFKFMSFIGKTKNR